MDQRPKQMLVIRKDLNMRKGKIAAQAAHASMKVLLDSMEVVRDPMFPLTWHRMATVDGDALSEWLSGLFTKICVSVDNEQELLDIYNKAKQANLLCSLITDSGLTEFNGVPTITCAAIGPAYPEQLDPITGHLKLV